MQLMEHQLKATELAKDRPRFCFFWDCGSGKTMAMLAICNQGQHRSLVICPKSVMQAAWGEDAKHFPDMSTEVIWCGNKHRRMKAIRASTAKVVITNFDTFKNHLDLFVEAGFFRLIVDESSKAKGASKLTKITTSIINFADRMKSVYLLSGTPAPNCPTEYWAQLRACEPQLFAINGRIPRFNEWANRYFVPVKRTINKRKKGATPRSVVVGWVPKQDRSDDFLKKLSSVSWSLTKADCMDLPEQTNVVRDVLLSPDERRAYNQAKDELRVAGSTIAREAALTKCRQLAGGWAYYDTGEPWYSAAEKPSSRQPTSKLSTLEELLIELGQTERANKVGGRPVIIWAEFREDIRAIKCLCLELGMEVAVIDGSINQDDRNKAIEQMQAGELDAIIANPQAAGHGITLTRASDAIYYGLSFSYEQHKQSRDRIHRKGQTKPCTYYYLIAKDTVDEALYWCLKNKKKKADGVTRVLGQSSDTKATAGNSQ